MFVPGVVALAIGEVAPYLSSHENMLATARAAEPLPADVPTRLPAQQEGVKSADAHMAPDRPAAPHASPAVVGEAAPAIAGSGANPPRPPVLSARELSDLLSHGDILFGTGNVAGARLFFERGAGAGDTTAALRLGETFDPTFLDPSGLGSAADPAQAARWYRQARALGNADAEFLLNHLNEFGS